MRKMFILLGILILSFVSILVSSELRIRKDVKMICDLYPIETQRELQPLREMFMKVIDDRDEYKLYPIVKKRDSIIKDLTKKLRWYRYPDEDIYNFAEGFYDSNGLFIKVEMKRVYDYINKN